jgi:hypothetical protein
MSSINQQDLFAIPGVNSLDQESAATVSGGLLTLSDLRNGRGTRVRTGTDGNLGRAPGVRNFNNRASWYSVPRGGGNWNIYSRPGFQGFLGTLRAGTSGNLLGNRNNNIESVRAAR